MLLLIFLIATFSSCESLSLTSVIATVANTTIKTCSHLTHFANNNNCLCENSDVSSHTIQPTDSCTFEQCCESDQCGVCLECLHQPLEVACCKKRICSQCMYNWMEEQMFRLYRPKDRIECPFCKVQFSHTNNFAYYWVRAKCQFSLKQIFFWLQVCVIFLFQQCTHGVLLPRERKLERKRKEQEIEYRNQRLGFW